MSDPKTSTYLISDARKALAQSRLSSALASLAEAANALGDWETGRAVSELSNAYSALLNYMSLGVADPDRHNLYHSFLRTAAELCDDLSRADSVRHADTAYARTRRTLQALPGRGDLTQLYSAPAPLRDRFDALWTSPRLTAAEQDALQNFFTVPTLFKEETPTGREAAQLMAAGALTLALLSMFDVRKLHLLLDGCSSPSAPLRARCIVGVTLAVLQHSNRIADYPDAAARLTELLSREECAAAVCEIQQQALLTLATPHIEKSLREDILPEVMRQAKNMGMPKAGDNIDIDEIARQLDPEGQDTAVWNVEADAPWRRKIQEIQKFAEQGADVFLPTFKQLMQRMPFFNVVANWFCPFTAEHPDFPARSANSSFVQAFMAQPMACETDKFAFCFIADSFSSFTGGATGAALGEQLKKMLEENDIAARFNAADAPPRSFLEELRVYMKDLRRFFSLSPYRRDGASPLQQHLLMTDNQWLAPALGRPAALIAAADIAMHVQSFANAYRLYSDYLSHAAGIEPQAQAEALQKLGYCREQLGELVDAEEIYNKALLLCGDNSWVLARLAKLHSRRADYVGAAELYDRVAQLTEETDTTPLVRAAECYLLAAMPEEARQRLFKADYLKPEQPRTRRALAWSSLLMEKYEDAERLYSWLLERQPTAADCQNAAHLAWITRSLPEALPLYRRALQLSEAGTPPAALFRADRSFLLSHGLKEEDLQLAADLLEANLP